MNQFVFTENMLSLFMGQANGEDVYQSGFIVVQAGVNDLLFIDSQDGIVQLEVISTTRLMSYLDQFVTHLEDTQIAVEKPTYTLDIEKKVTEQEKEKTDSTTKVFCTECGVELNSNQKILSSMWDINCCSRKINDLSKLPSRNNRRNGILYEFVVKN